MTKEEIAIENKAFAMRNSERRWKRRERERGVREEGEDIGRNKRESKVEGEIVNNSLSP